MGQWKCAILNTDTTFGFTYGYIEVRAKIPKGQGMWPAIWTYNYDYAADEIDILEYLGGDPGRAYQTYHWPGSQKQFSVFTTDWSAAYHTWAVKWEPNLLVFYVDGVERGRHTTGVSTRRMYLMINNDAGCASCWGGPVDATTPYPNFVDVDYVRIYRKP